MITDYDRDGTAWSRFTYKANYGYIRGFWNKKPVKLWDCKLYYYANVKRLEAAKAKKRSLVGQCVRTIRRAENWKEVVDAVADPLKDVLRGREGHCCERCGKSPGEESVETRHSLHVRVDSDLNVTTFDVAKPNLSKSWKLRENGFLPVRASFCSIDCMEAQAVDWCRVIEGNECERFYAIFATKTDDLSEQLDADPFMASLKKELSRLSRDRYGKVDLSYVRFHPCFTM